MRTKLRKRPVSPLLVELKEIRLDMGLSREAFNTTPESTLLNWEHGGASPSLYGLEIYLEELGYKLTLEKIDESSSQVA